MRFWSYFTFFLCLCSATGANAQETKNASIFKYSLLGTTSGEIVFSFEQQLKKTSSVELEFGPTISEIDPLNLAKSRHRTEGDYDYDYLTNQKGIPTSTLSGIGFVAGVQFRVYPLQTERALSKLYIAPSLRYKVYNYAFEVLETSEYSGKLPSFSSSERRSAFSMNMGYQWWLSEQITFDAYVGLGLQLKQSEAVRAIADGSSGTVETYWTSKTTSRTNTLGMIGVKVGFAF